MQVESIDDPDTVPAKRIKKEIEKVSEFVETKNKEKGEKKEEKIKPHVTGVFVIDEYPPWQTPVKLEE